MATKVIINGRTTSIPGAYSILKPGVNNAPAQLPYGNVLLIDTGVYGGTWGGGTGIAGTNVNGKESITAFENVNDFRNFVKGGFLWKLGAPLFQPYRNYPGVSKLYFVSARATAPGTISPTFQGGVLAFKPLEEGLITNGTLDAGTSTNLTKGYAMQFLAAPAGGGYIVRFYLGTYRGFDSDNNVYYQNSELQSIPNNFLTTPVLASPQALYNWMLTSSAFQAMFGSVTFTALKAIKTSTIGAGGSGWVNGDTFTVNTGTTLATGHVTGVSSGAITTYVIDTPGAGYVVASGVALTATTGVGIGATINVTVVEDAKFVNADLASNPGYVLSSGATETYNSTYVTEAIQSIGSLDNTMILCDGWGDDGTSDANVAILDFINHTAKYDEIMFVGGGVDKFSFKDPTDPTTSAGLAAFYNDEHVVVVHGAAKVAKSGGGFYIYNTMYKAANVLGRLAGLAPQDSVTFKGLDYDGEVHSLLYPDEYEYALDNGILATVYDDDLGIFCTLQGVDTVLDNDNVLNLDGTTFSIQLMRIEIQMNRDMAINAKKKLFSDPMHGPNRTTIDAASVITFVQGFLDQKIKDGLIVRYQNIQASLVPGKTDVFQATYEFVPNYEITKLIITGTMLEA